jgi:hypothetical protein
MIVDRAWAQRNLGFDPIATPASAETFTVKKAARASATPEDLQREIIEFDSEAPEGLELLAASTATGLTRRFTEIPWPSALAPKADKKARRGKNSALPTADVLVVTWTVDEGHALSRVLTPGKDSRNDYVSYKHNYAKISRDMRPGCPARNAKRLGAYWTGTVGGKTVVYFKSDSHMSQDGPKLPNIEVWKQLIAEVQPKLVLTTGTAGGIGAQFEVGDVVVSPIVRFECIAKFKNKPFHDAHYNSESPDQSHFAKAHLLFSANSGQLPKDNTRQPKIFVVPDGGVNSSVVTTDFFGFDTSDNHYHLQGLGDVSEMGDAVLGLVASEIAGPPRWIAVRNVSDPQIKAEGTLRDQAKLAAQIYKAYGRWSSVCSAIVCWALIVTA